MIIVMKKEASRQEIEEVIQRVEQANHKAHLSRAMERTLIGATGEGGARAELNLGHTFGHALEKVSGYCLPHGRAVSMGLAMASRLAHNLGLCSPELERRVVACLERFDLPTGYGTYEPLAIWRAMGDDKKRESHKLRLVLPRELGRVSVTDEVSKEAILQVLEEKRLA